MAFDPGLAQLLRDDLAAQPFTEKKMFGGLCFLQGGNMICGLHKGGTMYRVGKEKATRIELRSPDPSANPYLTFALILAAGLKGIEGKYTLPGPIEENIFEMTQAQKDKLKIDTLPGSLEQAIALAEGSKLVKEALGEHVFNKLIENKKMEWDQYRIHVSQYETDMYQKML